MSNSDQLLILQFIATWIVCAIWLPPLHPFWLTRQLEHQQPQLPFLVACLLIVVWQLVVCVMVSTIAVVMERLIHKLLSRLPLPLSQHQVKRASTSA